MKELNASPSKLISIGYEGEDKVTKIVFRGVSYAGKRDTGSTLLLTKGWNTDRYSWIYSFVSGRGGSMQLKDVLDINSETFSDLTYEYGRYQQGDRGLLSGTVKIYGGKF